MHMFIQIQSVKKQLMDADVIQVLMQLFLIIPVQRYVTLNLNVQAEIAKDDGIKNGPTQAMQKNVKRGGKDLLKAFTLKQVKGSG